MESNYNQYQNAQSHIFGLGLTLFYGLHLITNDVRIMLHVKAHYITHIYRQPKGTHKLKIFLMKNDKWL